MAPSKNTEDFYLFLHGTNYTGALADFALLAGAQPLPAGGLMKLNLLHLSNTQITNAGCAALVDALDGNTLPALQVLNLKRVPASAEAKEAVREAMHRSIYHRNVERPSAGSLS